ncbi:MAG: ribosome recycling factor [Fusobacterium sp.]|nr:ribosome recycling factor [Fusobacterium sp.]
MTGQELIKECELKMEKTIEAVKDHFTSIRAGRASVSMLDTVRVDSYGSEVPLNQVGTVSAPEARLLMIDPWDKSLIPTIEKAILASNIGMTPNNDGRVIRLVMPELTAERRKEYVKLAKTEAENGRIAVRNVRKDANNHLRKLEKDKDSSMSEDELKKAEADVQTLTDKYIKVIDELFAKKEKEITTI